MKKEAEEAIENVACEENLGRNCVLHEGESGDRGERAHAADSDLVPYRP